MSQRPTTLAIVVAIPTSWTSEQALAVFELLDDLRDKIWAIHGDQIQALLQQEQGSTASIVHRVDPSSDDRSF